MIFKNRLTIEIKIRKLDPGVYIFQNYRGMIFDKLGGKNETSFFLLFDNFYPKNLFFP